MTKFEPLLISSSISEIARSNYKSGLIPYFLDSATNFFVLSSNSTCAYAEINPYLLSDEQQKIIDFLSKNYPTVINLSQRQFKDYDNYISNLKPIYRAPVSQIYFSLYAFYHRIKILDAYMSYFGSVASPMSSPGVFYASGGTFLIYESINQISLKFNLQKL